MLWGPRLRVRRSWAMSPAKPGAYLAGEMKPLSWGPPSHPNEQAGLQWQRGVTVEAGALGPPGSRGYHPHRGGATMDHTW